jgi:hypothetical protein
MTFSFPALFLAMLIGNLFWRGLAVAVLSYNSFTNALLLTSTGLFLLAVSDLQIRRGQLLLIAAGFITGIDGLIKPSSFLAYWGITCLVLFFYYRKQRPTRWLLAILFFTFGAVLGLAFLLFGLHTYDLFMAYLPYTPGQSFPNMGAAHDLSSMINTYISSAKDLLDYLLHSVWVLVLTAGVIWLGLFRKKGTMTRLQRVLLPVALVGLALLYFFSRSFTLVDINDNSSVIILFYLLVLFVIFIADVSIYLGRVGSLKNMLHWLDEEFHRQILLICGYFLILPALIALGTNNSLMTVMRYHIIYWFAIGFILLIFLDSEPRLKIPVWGLLSVVVVFMTYQWTSNVLYHPYRLLANLPNQTAPLGGNFPRDAQLLLDKGSWNFLEDIYQAVHTRTDFRPGDPIIGLYNLPGVVYMLGGYSPGAIWYTAAQANLSAYCTSLGASEGDRSRAIIMVTRTIPDPMIKCLHKSLINFPENYEMVATIKDPYRKNTEVSIYQRIKTK